MDIKPNEICFLNYIDGLDHSNNLPDYWKYNYGINPNKVALKLINLGLLEFKVDIKKNISSLTIPELKEILKSNNLPLKGKKDDLIANILGNIDLSYLEMKFPTKRYCLTSDGKKLLEKKYLFIINQKENYNFNDDDILIIYQKHSEKDNKTKLIELFNYTVKKDLVKKDYSDLNLRIWQFYNFYLKLDLYEEALFYFIVSFKLTLFNLRTIESKVYLDDISYINIDNNFINKLKNIISLTDASQDKLRYIIETESITESLPFKYFSNEECCKILIDLLNNKKFNVMNYKITKPEKNNLHYIYYGFNDEEIFKNPKKAIYNKIYSRTNIGLRDIFRWIKPKKSKHSK